jgi:hypothetical protein
VLFVFLAYLISQVGQMFVGISPNRLLVRKNLAILLQEVSAKKGKGDKPPRKENPEQQTYDRLRNEGSRQLSPKLRALYNEYAERWTEILNAMDNRGRQSMVNSLYDNLRAIVADHDGSVEQNGDCWRRLVQLRNNVHVWRNNVTQISPLEVNGLLNEILDLAKDFPLEADVNRRAAGQESPESPNANHTCGQDLERIYKIYEPKWRKAKEGGDMTEGHRQLRAIPPLLHDFIDDHGSKVPQNARWDSLIALYDAWNAYIEYAPNDNLWRQGDLFFADMLDVAQSFQLAH